MDGEFSGIDPGAMTRFEQGLAKAEEAIGRNEPAIRRTLQRFDLEASGLNSLRELQNWIAETRPDLRRRRDTIQSEQSEWGATPDAAAVAAFDESLYSRAVRVGSRRIVHPVSEVRHRSPWRRVWRSHDAEEGCRSWPCCCWGPLTPRVRSTRSSGI
ncbi:hypothetical protein [Spongiactinospora sp. TRM90649]|uniref:hypothetical protein n=1 Tax=Spongiactinospora sp. TRM90649 TaxID=3031114 RepID=UPI0023F9F49A|nr:hypothetical protein [Spongiactinospora sp. TRM90649]MDF5759172.1 hypothetical protein [Spongiactinospora sp. TRM90649]